MAAPDWNGADAAESLRCGGRHQFLFDASMLNQEFNSGVWQVLPTALSKLPPDGAQIGCHVRARADLQLNLGKRRCR